MAVQLSCKNEARDGFQIRSKCYLARLPPAPTAFFYFPSSSPWKGMGAVSGAAAIPMGSQRERTAVALSPLHPKTTPNATPMGPQGQKVAAWCRLVSEGFGPALRCCCEGFECVGSGGWQCFGVAASLPARVAGGSVVALESPSGLPVGAEWVSILETFS